jgi:hypothetical protein
MYSKFQSDIKMLAPWLARQECFKTFAAGFASQLEHQAEFSFYLGKSHWEITLKGEGETFYRAVSKFIPPEHLSLYREILKFMPNSPGLLKINFKPSGKYQASLYFPAPLALEALHHWLKRRGLANLDFAWFAELCRIIGHRALFPGFDFAAGTAVEPGIFFILVRKTEISALDLEAVARHCGLEHSAVVKPHRTLQPFARALYLSTNVSTPHSLKLDYENIPVTAALSVLPVTPKLERLIAGINLEQFYYLGIRYSPRRPPAYKIYFKRSYSQIDPLAAFAEALTQTIWI